VNLMPAEQAPVVNVAQGERIAWKGLWWAVVGVRGKFVTLTPVDTTAKAKKRLAK